MVNGDRPSAGEVTDDWLNGDTKRFFLSWGLTFKLNPMGVVTILVYFLIPCNHPFPKYSPLYYQ